MPVSTIKTKVNLYTDVQPSNDGQTPPNMVAYVFSSNGRLLGQQPLEKGQSALEISAKEGSRVSVFVGPEITGDVTRAALHRRGAVVNDMIVSERGLNLKLPIEVDIWKPWLFGLCMVRGTMLKHVQFGPLGFNLPVPNAHIEIFEVDSLPKIIWELPDHLLDRLREELLRPKPFPFPPDPPPFEIDPFPLPDLNVFDAQPIALRAKDGGGMAAAGAAAQARSVKALSNGNGAAHIAAQSHAVTASPSVLQYMAANASDLQFRQSLVANAALVYPILCLLSPNIITMTQVATAITDDCGRFRTHFIKNYQNPDQPDLYFRAKQQIFPLPFPMITIYAPTPISCHTHWNYQCGTEVTLVTNNQLTIARPRCVDLSDGVIVEAVGHRSLANIRGTSAALQASTTASNRGLTSDGRPWGGVLRLRLEFDPDLPTTDVKYYRVSYKRNGEPANTAVALDDSITWTTLRFDSTGPIRDSYVIGPKTAPNGTSKLYEIHSRGNNAPNGLGFWSGDVVVNYTNAIFDTRIPAGAVPATDPNDKAGLFDIIVELFNANGDPIVLADEGINFYVPESNPGDTQPDLASSLGLMQGNKFVFQLHVDNNPPVVQVNEPMIGAQGAGKCGSLEYTSLTENVDVNYIAGQRNGFATYSFSIIKGHSDARLTVGSTNAGSGSDTLIRTSTATTNLLLNTPANPVTGEPAHNCSVAGLRATATVSPMATDGWNSVYHDISDTYSFALSPRILPPHP